MVSSVQNFNLSANALHESPLSFKDHFSKVPAAENYTHKAPDWQGVYLLTNEVNCHQTAQKMQEKDERGSCIIGISGFFNFELFLAREAKGVKYLINIDPVPCYRAFWQLVEEKIKPAKTVLEFYDEVAVAIYAEPSKFYSDSFLIHLSLPEYLEAGREYCEKVVDTDEKFQKLKQLFSEGRFVHHPVDLGNESQVSDLMALLGEIDCLPDTVYVSNVQDDLPQAAHASFQTNLTILCKSTAYRIDAHRKIVDTGYTAPEISPREYRQVIQDSAEA